MKYEEVQNNEVEALKAIYDSDFTELPNSSAWSKRPSPKFSVQLRPSSEFENSPMSLTVQVTMTPTYPKTLPGIEITSSNALSGRQLETLKQCIDQTIKELKGSEMIFEVTSNIQFQIDEWARSVSEAAPNLEEDRLRRLRLEERKQKEQQDQIQREREVAAMREEEKYDSLVLEELQRSEALDGKALTTNDELQRLIVVPESTLGVTTFERAIELPQAFNDDNQPAVFRQVMSGLRMRQAFFGTSYMGRAVLPDKRASSDDLTGLGDTNGGQSSDIAMLLTKVGFSSEFWRTSAGTKKLNELNSELSVIKKFRHPGILPLCEFMIERYQERAIEWELILLTPLSRLTPLSDILDSSDCVSLKTAQRWSFQILEALESLHKAGLRHRCVCPENAVVNVDLETGETSMILRHPQYLYWLYSVNETHPFEPSSSSRNANLPCCFYDTSIQWTPPEGRGHSKPTSPSSKWDIWQFGVLLTLMVVGKRDLSHFKGDAESYVRSRPRRLPPDLIDLLLSALHRDPSRRPGALELLTDQFFRSDFELYVDEFDTGSSLADGIHNQSLHALGVPSTAPTSDSTATLAPRNTASKSSSTYPASGSTNKEGGGSGSAEGSYGRRRLSNNDENSAFSRYKQDFDEGIVLGRGGFGQVVKARNKLDGRVYAVKKIRATPSTLSHILQEVVLLSRLNHQYVVRYYTVWLEDESENNDSSVSLVQMASDGNAELEKNISLDSLSSSLVRQSSQRNILDSIPSTSLSQFSAHHSLSELDIPSVSHDFMSDSGFIEFGFSDSDQEAVIDEDESTNVSGSRHSSQIFESNKSENSESEPQGVRNQDMRRADNKTSSKLLSRLSRIAHKTLYIQMEYCENHTLGDLISQNLCKNPPEYWRLLRQILEALAYIHGEGVIHRDLKPKNIFIDQARNIKIGDFGLARSMIQPLQSRQQSVEVNSPLQRSANSTNELINMDDDEDLTTDVGTSLYSAIEITTSKDCKRGYNEKVDIFSLGIIFFEMVWETGTDMERIQNIRKARTPQIELPSQFIASRDLHVQVELIRAMLNHDPSKRPSAMGLLESGKIPIEEQKLTVQEALRNIHDPHMVQQLTNALFSRPLITAQQVLYDRANATSGSRRQQPSIVDSGRSLTLSYVQSALKYIFRAHGAVENTVLRSRIFPRSAIYKGPTVVELLDLRGTVLQLPHDLTLPYARRLAEVVPDYRKSYAIDTVYRTNLQNPGLHPAKHVEVDFDIISTSDSMESLMFDEAETIAVMYDSVNLVLNGSTYEGNMSDYDNSVSGGFDTNLRGSGGSYSNLNDAIGISRTKYGDSENGLAIVIGHHDILSATLSHCGLSPPQYFAAISLLSSGSLDRRGNSLSRSNISTASLDMLAQFGFRESFSHAESRMSRLMPLSDRVRRGLAHVKSVAATFKRLCATSHNPQLYFSPLIHTATSEFYVNGVIFQLVETRNLSTPNSSSSPTRQSGFGSVLAVGGRYDSLVKSFRNSVLDSRTPLARAVGFEISTEKLVMIVTKQQLQSQQNQQSQTRNTVPSRCKVLVSSLSETSLNTLGLDAVKLLWRYGINADIVRDITSTEELLDQAAKENVALVVIVKQMHALSNTNSKFKPLRIKRVSASGGSQSHGGDVDLGFSDLIPFIQNELGITSSNSAELESSAYLTHGESPSLPDIDSSSERVIVLNESGKLKGGRKNKWQLEERGAEARNQFLTELGNCPVVSLDLRDDVIEAITTVSPHAAEDWKRRVVGLSPNQKAYIMTVQSKLSTEATRSPRMLLFSSKTENVFVYNY